MSSIKSITLPAELSGQTSKKLKQFPLVVASSLILSSVLYSLVGQYTAGDLGSVSRSLQGWEEVAALITWRSTELGIAWWSNYDGPDLACLTLLTHLPPLYLLQSFYSVHPKTIITSLTIDLLATYLPFRFFRPLAPAHLSTSAPAHTRLVPNSRIIDDFPVRALTTALASTIYATVIYASYHSFLPIYLITHFDGIRDMSAAHAPSFPMLILTSIPIGYAAQEFLFSTATGSHIDVFTEGESSKDKALRRDDATQKSKIDWTTTSTWPIVRSFFSPIEPRAKQLAVRTAILVLLTGFNTWVQLFVTVEGVENEGAMGYSALWATAAALTGSAFYWVGDV